MTRNWRYTRNALALFVGVPVVAWAFLVALFWPYIGHLVT
jgi:hypothetical protein